MNLKIIVIIGAINFSIPELTPMDAAFMIWHLQIVQIRMFMGIERCRSVCNISVNAMPKTIHFKC